MSTEDSNSSNSSNSDEQDIKVEKKQVIFEWEPMSSEWETKLLSKSFMIKDTIDDGNSQFRAIETALIGFKNRSHIEIRADIARYINKMPKIEFNNIIDLYKIEKDTGTFKSKWNPYKLNTKKDFNSEIKRPGRRFVGDNIILSLIPYILGIDFIVFDNNFSIIDLSNPKLENKYYCILYSDNNVYKTIGLSKGDSIKTIFKKSKLPPELKLILDRELLIISHMKHIKSSSLHDTLDDLSERLKITLSRSDREFVCTLINC
jgi:hypothetical protein